MANQPPGEPLSETADLHRIYRGPLDAFYDAETHGPLNFELRRISKDDWQVLRRFGYHHHDYDEPFVCPHDVDAYTTDLASTPWIFQWVVPARGVHFPAIMLHDALVAPAHAPSHLGPPVSREEADGIMRDAMASLGVGLIRRWLAWTGAFLATAWTTMQPSWRWRSLVTLTFGLIAVLGVLATIDLLDGAEILPWMGDRPWLDELVAGGIAAVVIPVLLSLLWGRRWPAAVIGGISLAGLLHVTAAMAFTYLLYRLGELATSRWQRAEGEVERNQEMLRDHMRASVQVGGSTATYIDLRIPASSVRVVITGPQMLVSGLRLVTDLGILDGHDHPGLTRLADGLNATSFRDPAGPKDVDITVEVDRRGPALVVDAGTASTYESVLEITTTEVDPATNLPKTFQQLLKDTIGRHTGRGFVAGLVPVWGSGHGETAHHHDGEEVHETDDAGNRNPGDGNP